MKPNKNWLARILDADGKEVRNLTIENETYATAVQTAMDVAEDACIYGYDIEITELIGEGYTS